MMLTKKIKAGALQFVLFIGAVIAVLLMAFMLLSYTHTMFDKKTDIVVDLIKSADYGLAVSLGKNTPLEEDVVIPHENDALYDLQGNRSFWGIFEKYTIRATHGKTKLLKTALTGEMDPTGMQALYLCDRQRPLIIAGDAMVTGTSFLPEQGIKMGNIYGNSYHRDRLIYGKQKVSDSLLPLLSTELQSQLKKLTSTYYEPVGEVLDLGNTKEAKNSFQSPTKIIRGRVIRLSDINLTGNIIVSASNKIIVEQSAQLHDVILLAPKIIVKNWVKGNFQAIASEHITVGKKCILNYPTAIVVHKKDSSSPTTETKKTSEIYIDSYAEINGVVMAIDKTKEHHFLPQIKIDDQAKVRGEVYCTKNMELKGRVNGSVITNGFIALENGSIYQNHLYNGQINSDNLSKAYVGLLMKKGVRTKKIMKWLY